MTSSLHILQSLGANSKLAFAGLYTFLLMVFVANTFADQPRRHIFRSPAAQVEKVDSNFRATSGSLVWNFFEPQKMKKICECTKILDGSFVV